MRSIKFQTIEIFYYTHCTIEEVVDEVFDQVQPTEEHNKEDICSLLRIGAKNLCVSRRIDGALYSAIIGYIGDGNYQVTYITDYL